MDNKRDSLKTELDKGALDLFRLARSAHKNGDWAMSFDQWLKTFRYVVKTHGDDV